MKIIGEIIEEDEVSRRFPEGTLVVLDSKEMSLMRMVVEHFEDAGAVLTALHKVKFGAEAFDVLSAALRKDAAK